jgi:hypothetical protein
MMNSEGRAFIFGLVFDISITSDGSGGKMLNNKNRVKLAQLPTTRSSDFEAVGMSLAEK